MGETRWQRAIEFVGATVEGDLVILDVEAGYYYRLNRTAARVWELVDVPATKDELVEALVRSFNVTKEECATSLGRLLDRLAGLGLVKQA